MLAKRVIRNSAKREALREARAKLRRMKLTPDAFVSLLKMSEYGVPWARVRAIASASAREVRK